MPALAPYIPNKDASFNNWLINFSTLLTAAPATYGLTTANATSVAGVTATWSAAYALVTSPSTKTKATVAAKDTARVNALAITRPLAILISLNAGVASSDKTAIGVNPRTSVPVPITPPTTYPDVSIASQLHQIWNIAYRDSLSSPSVKAKPYGVVQIQIFGQTSATPITDQNALPLITQITKSPNQIAWASADVGKTAYVAARYVTRKGLLGPWSPIISGTVA